MARRGPKAIALVASSVAGPGTSIRATSARLPVSNTHLRLASHIRLSPKFTPNTVGFGPPGRLGLNVDVARESRGQCRKK
jgi:hypothetical protein